MRLIDADKLKRKCQKTATEAWKMKIKASIETTLNQFIDWIDQAEPVDAVPVVHGQWIIRTRHEHYPSGRAYEEIVCPFCGKVDHNGDGNFCGYCGARMDGKDGETHGAK